MQPLAADDPRTMGDYRLLRRLGVGGMGRVYLGRTPGGRTVAVKVVHAHFATDDQFRARFRREIEAARRVGGDWTAPVLDADPQAATPWVATGYVAGPSLQQAVDTHGRLPEHSVRALGAGLGEALETVHRLDLVHRDVKPSNVLLTLDGPRLIDFGIARATDGTASLTATGVSIGSPGYMSPEQVLGRGIDDATDVFSLGAVLAFAATGGAPFPGDSSAALLYKVVHEEPELDGLDGELRDIVQACLAKDPAARPSASEVAGRLSGGDGAAALVVGGWLPGPVVEGVSRRAVELLELEAEPVGPPTLTPSAPGGFGPPDPSYGDYGGASGTYPLGGGTGGTGGAGATGSPGVPPEQPKRGKRGLLLGAAAVAMAGLATAAFFLLGPDNDGNGTTGGSSAGGTSGGGETQTGSVPEAFIGTWSGSLTSERGNPVGTVTVKLQGGKQDEDVAELTYDALGMVQCHAIGRMSSAQDGELVLEERAGDGNGALCTGATAEVTLTEEGMDRLAYASDDKAGGKPTGTLTKGGN